MAGLPWWLSDKECACQAGESSLIPGSGRSPEKKMATHSCILGWEILRTEESGGLQSVGLHESDTTEGLNNSSKINYYHVTWNNRLVPNRKRSTPSLYIVTLLI